jgi:hypothetical protein
MFKIYCSTSGYVPTDDLEILGTYSARHQVTRFILHFSINSCIILTRVPIQDHYNMKLNLSVSKFIPHQHILAFTDSGAFALNKEYKEKLGEK